MREVWAPNVKGFWDKGETLEGWKADKIPRKGVVTSSHWLGSLEQIVHKQMTVGKGVAGAGVFIVS